MIPHWSQKILVLEYKNVPSRSNTQIEDSKGKNYQRLRIYADAKGNAPFEKWINGFKDKMTQARLAKRLVRVRQGNLGKHKNLKRGLLELIFDFGPGYRIYCSIVGKSALLLLAGSDKSDQKQTIAKARQYLADYKQRNTDQEEENDNVNPIRGDSR